MSELQRDILPTSREISNENTGSVEYQNLAPGATIVVTDEVTMNRIVEQKIRDTGFGDQIQQNRTSIDDLTSRNEANEQSIADNARNIEQNKRLVDSATTGLTGAQESIIELTRQQSESSSKIQSIEGNQTLMASSIVDVKNEVKQLESSMTQGSAEIGKINQKISDNENNINSLMSRVDQHDQDMETTKQSISLANAKAEQATQSATEAGAKADTATQKAEETKTLVGDISGLNVSNKTSVSSALDEVINVVNDNKSKVEENTNKIGDLSTTGLPQQNQGSVVEGIKYLKGQVENIEREQTSSKTNIERRLDAVEAKAEINSSSMRYIGTLTEDKDTVEAMTGTKNDWLDAQVGILKPGETAHNGNFILTSDGHTYHRYGDTWLLELKNDNTISIASDSTQGIMKGKSDKGYGYIGSTGDGDGTFKLVDYEDMKRSIDEKATSRSLSDLEAKVDKKTGDYSTLSLSGSDNGKPVSVVEIANAILGVIGSLSTISGVNNTTIVDAINGVLNKLTTTDNNVDAKMPKAGGNFTGNVTVDQSVSSFSDNDIFPVRHLKTFLGDFSTVDVSSKGTITEILKSLLVLVKSNQSAISDADGKIGQLDSTGIPSGSQTSVSTSLKYLNDQYSSLNQNYTSNKSAVEGRLDDLTLKVNANSNSMKYIGRLSEDKDTIEGKGGGRDAWLDLQVPVLKPGLTAMNGSIIVTSDGHSYYRTGDAWVLKEERPIELGTDSVAGIMKGRTELGQGYICSTGEGDGSFKLVDYQNLKQSIDSKGEKRTLDEVKTSLETKTGDYSTLNLTGSNNGKPASVVEIATALMSLIGNLSTLSTSAKDNIVNAVNELQASLSSINSNMSGYMPKTGGEFTNNVSISQSISSFNPNDLIPKRHLTGVLGDFSSLNLSSKGTVTEALNSLLDLTKANTIKIGQNTDKIGDLSSTGLPQQNQTSVSEGLKYAKTEIDAVKQKQIQDKQDLTSRLDVLTNKVNINSTSMRYIGTLSEDKNTVEAKGGGKDAWLDSQVGVLKPGETAQNGNFILTSDKHAYHRYGDAWFLVEKDAPITLGNDSDAGLIKGKIETGHGYIKSTGLGDGTFELVDYQDIMDSIRGKVGTGDLNSYKQEVNGKFGDLSNINLSGSHDTVENAFNTLITLIGTVSSISGVSNTSIVEAINEIVSGLNTVKSKVNNALPTSGGEITGKITCGSGLSSFTDNELVPGSYVKEITGDKSSLTTGDKGTLVAAINEIKLLVDGAMPKTGGEFTGKPSIASSLSNFTDNELIPAKYVDSKVGNLNNANTQNKDNVVAMINETLNLIGGLSGLTTSEKRTLVGAVNELVTSIGALSSLQTQEKSSLVLALNEVISKAVFKDGDQDLTGNIKISNTSPLLKLENTDSFEHMTIKLIDNGLKALFELSNGNFQFNQVLGYLESINYVVSNDHEIPAYKQIKDEFLSLNKSGDVNSLTTTFKGDIVGAINEVNEIATINSAGLVSSLDVSTYRQGTQNGNNPFNGNNGPTNSTWVNKIPGGIDTSFVFKGDPTTSFLNRLSDDGGSVIVKAKAGTNDAWLSFAKIVCSKIRPIRESSTNGLSIRMQFKLEKNWRTDASLYGTNFGIFTIGDELVTGTCYYNFSLAVDRLTSDSRGKMTFFVGKNNTSGATCDFSNKESIDTEISSDTLDFDILFTASKTGNVAIYVNNHMIYNKSPGVDYAKFNYIAYAVSGFRNYVNAGDEEGSLLYIKSIDGYNKVLSDEEIGDIYRDKYFTLNSVDEGIQDMSRSTISSMSRESLIHYTDFKNTDINNKDVVPYVGDSFKYEGRSNLTITEDNGYLKHDASSSGDASVSISDAKKSPKLDLRAISELYPEGYTIKVKFKFDGVVNTNNNKFGTYFGILSVSAGNEIGFSFGANVASCNANRLSSDSNIYKHSGAVVADFDINTTDDIVVTISISPTKIYTWVNDHSFTTYDIPNSPISIGVFDSLILGAAYNKSAKNSIFFKSVYIYPGFIDSNPEQFVEYDMNNRNHINAIFGSAIKQSVTKHICTASSTIVTLPVNTVPNVDNLPGTKIALVLKPNI